MASRKKRESTAAPGIAANMLVSNHSKQQGTILNGHVLKTYVNDQKRSINSTREVLLNDYGLKTVNHDIHAIVKKMEKFKKLSDATELANFKSFCDLPFKTSQQQPNDDVINQIESQVDPVTESSHTHIINTNDIVVANEQETDRQTRTTSN